jgi:hypothetical protein
MNFKLLRVYPAAVSTDLCPDWSIILKIANEKSLRSRPNEIKISPKSRR